MTEPRIAPFGSWESPVTTELMTGKTVGLGSLMVDGDAIYWLESRPNEAGRSALVRWTRAGGLEELTPPPVNIGSRVHEYGGGAYAVSAGRIVYSEKSDGSLWLIEPGARTRQIATAAGCRYADFTFDLARNRLLAIREDHRDRPPTDPKTTIVALSLDSDEPARNEGEILVEGADFYSNPRLSPDGARLAWLAWDHPNMPWDGTRLLLATLDSAGRPGAARVVAGELPESVVQPLFAQDGTLYFSSDRTGWWNLYTFQNGRIEALHPIEAELGGPCWLFGNRYFAFTADGLVCSIVESGLRHAARLVRGTLTRLDIGAVQECPVPFGEGLAWISTEPQAPPAVQLLSGGKIETLRASGPAVLSEGNISVGEPISFPTEGGISHAFFYPPRNEGFVAPGGEKPPLIVTLHGGPTSMTTNGFSLTVQWWTTRGFAVVDVNYGGSTGFGRPFRQRLYGEWGVVDVVDCEAAVKALAERGLIDPSRVAIRGGSAGGYTTLACLAASTVFKAGASYFGVADLKLLAEDTHKFESRYLDNLLGPLPASEAIYRARSPIFNVGKIEAPAIFFQGLDDKVVPPNQAETMVEAMAERQLPVAYYAFAGEGHGFRKAETIRRTLELELGFYGRIFGFDPPGLTERVELRNLP
ncbi:MAG TPA: S9 family peptidase [Aliidongia sp.]|nr:S9 family peptidase [Aliidongia sp.]